MKLTDQNKIDIVQKFLNGDSYGKLAKEYGVLKNAIVCILKVRGITRENKNGK
jgi:transposase-like protein